MDSNKWADRKTLMSYMLEKQSSSLGPKPEKTGKKKGNKMTTEEKKA